VEFFREYDKPGVRGLPEYGFVLVIPGENPLFIGGKKHPRGEITPNGDYPVRTFLRGREAKPVIFGEVGKLGILTGTEPHGIRIAKRTGYVNPEKP
jgi:hypothetical protein